MSVKVAVLLGLFVFVSWALLRSPTHPPMVAPDPEHSLVRGIERVPLGLKHTELSSKLRKTWVREEWNRDDEGRSYSDWKGDAQIFRLPGLCGGMPIYAVSMLHFQAIRGSEVVNLGAGWSGSAGTHVAILVETPSALEPVFFDVLVELIGVRESDQGLDCPPIVALVREEESEVRAALRYDQGLRQYQIEPSSH